jgi:hypothetical protein
MRKLLLKTPLATGLALFALGLCVAGAPARADTVAVNWYTVTPGIPDFTGNECCGVYANEVLPALGPDGLPVVNTTVTNDNPYTLLDVNGHGELQWWTPGAGVAYTGTSTLSVPVGQNMFIPNGTGTNDSTGFQTAIMRGLLVVGSGGGSITFGGDDDMLLALGNTVVGQVGGVHAFGSLDTVSVGPGTYTLTAFYADRQQVAAYADLSIAGGTITAVPEPATWAMMLLGFAGLGFAGYRRTRSRRDALAAA